MTIIRNLFFIIALTSGLQVSATELGPTGNAYIAQRYAQYLAGDLICAQPLKSVPRVILLGFAPFRLMPENVSGKIIQSFGQFSLTKQDVDAYGTTREVEIDGVTHQICFIVAATIWDISAAILIHEMESFQPEFVLMSGIGFKRVSFESGNSNRASSEIGYDMLGQPLQNIFPQQNYVLPNLEESTGPVISQLTWNPHLAKQAAEEQIAKLGFEAAVPVAGYPENNFVCNNIAFAATHAALGLKTELAGGMISFEPKFDIEPKIGFMHYPTAVTSTPESLAGWQIVLEKIIASQVPVLNR